jgi:hypothetical protein
LEIALAAPSLLFRGQATSIWESAKRARLTHPIRGNQKSMLWPFRPGETTTPSNRA